MSSPANRWTVACINWSHPSAPHALVYLSTDEGAMHERYFPTWAEAIAAVAR